MNINNFKAAAENIVKNSSKTVSKASSKAVRDAGAEQVKNITKIIDDVPINSIEEFTKAAKESVKGTASKSTTKTIASKIGNEAQDNYKVAMEIFHEEALMENAKRGMDAIHEEALIENAKFDWTKKLSKTKEYENELKGRKPRSHEEYAKKNALLQKDRLENEYSEAMSIIDSEDQLSLNSLYNKYKVERGNKDELISKIGNRYSEQASKIDPNPNLKTWMGYNKVPQKTAAVGGTAWLISKMSSAKGNQSNAELYGQQTPYM